MARGEREREKGKRKRGTAAPERAAGRAARGRGGPFRRKPSAVRRAEKGLRGGGGRRSARPAPSGSEGPEMMMITPR